MANPLHRMERVRAVWDTLRTSLWFVPAVMVLVAFALAPLGDSRLGDRAARDIGWLIYAGGPEDARALLATLLSSTITMASLVFSITMVVLSLAARQFGPRLIRNFMNSWLTQLMLGTSVMTSVYCLLVLAAVGGRSGGGPYLYISVTLGILSALTSVCLLILYLHALARSIMPDTVIGRVGHELDAVLASLPQLVEVPHSAPLEALPDDFHDRADFSGTAEDGYIQAVEFDRITAAAKDADVLVGLFFRPGDFVARGGRGIGVYPAERCRPDLREAIRSAILIGTHRTPAQDPDFSIRHLVEIATRALSPGTNDPYTAVAAVHQLSASLARLMSRALPSGIVHDDTGQVRMLYPAATYSSLIGTAFDQIRQDGAEKPLVMIHLLESIARIAEHVRAPAQHEALEEQLRVLAQTARHAIADPHDRADIERRASATARALGRTRREREPAR